ncbi:hypothetical protein, partial [Caulobacter sp. 17J65-9]|uniref:YfaP family protein n=1 Tax=Caulobacter sp. 17J65-9 TaxID=2709382 RepID=UPI0013C5B8CA
RVYRIDRASARPHDAAGALWGAARVSELAARKAPQDKVLAAARRWSVAGPDAVFVVLERVEDYAEAEIEPPAALGKEALAQWRELTAEREARKAAERAERVDAVVEAWDEQKAWWNAAHKSLKEVQAQLRREQPRESRRDAPVPAAAMAPPPPPPPPPPPSVEEAAPAADAAASVDEVVVTGARMVRQDFTEMSPVATVGAEAESIKVEIEPWNPDRPYLKALAEAAPDAFWNVYREQEKAHGDLPAFYLDVGEFLFRKGRTDAAVAVALNALELPSTDTTTLTILADRLMRYGRTDRAIALYELILKREPDRPQPRRNLALALIERADRGGDGSAVDYARALDLLAEVIQTPWDRDYDGIELISLMEANRAAARAKAPARRWLDPRLEALLDVDLRVVLEWNTDKTDMDLWLDEPSGERAIYSHPKTGIGGRLSNDMTRGYGPEEYLLRRAPNGEYAVRVHGYAFDRLNPNGATSVRARLYRNWGRADETMEQLEIELTRDERDGQLVGKFKVGK